jgi:DNA-binding MarR family transcriptional regulator
VTNANGRHPRHDLDEQLNAPVRLSLLALLAQVENAEFATVRDALDVSDSVLSKQVSQLEAAGYVRVTKGYVGKRPRTWISATTEGEGALRRHLTALRAVIGEL